MPAASGKVKGVAEIELKIDKFIQPAENLKRSLDSVEKKAKSTWNSTGAVADLAGNKMSGAGSKSKAAFTGMGNAAQMATPKIQQSAGAISNMNMAMLANVSMSAGMLAGFIGLSASLVNIPKRITDVEKTLLDLSKTTLSLDKERANAKRMEIEIDKARADGTKTVEELTRMEQERVFVMRNMDDIANDLLIKEEELIQKQDELNHAWLLTGSAVAMTALSGGSAIMMMLTTMAAQVNKTTGAFIALKLSVISNSGALKMMMPNIAAARVQFTLMRGTLMASGAAFAATGTKMSIFNLSLKTVGLGFKGLYLAMGPVGWAITAITLAVEAFEHNIGGFRDALSWVAGRELPKLSDALGGAAKKADMLRDSMSLLQDEFNLTSAQMLEMRAVIKGYNTELDAQIEKEKAADLEALRIELGLNIEQWEHITSMGQEMEAANTAAADSAGELNTELNTLGSTVQTTAQNFTGLQTQVTSVALAMDGQLVAAGSLHAQLGELFSNIDSGDRIKDLKSEMLEIEEALIRGSHSFEPGSPEYNLFLDGMIRKVNVFEDEFDTAFGEGAMMGRIRAVQSYSRGWKDVFDDIQAAAVETGKVIDNIGQKKTTLEVDLRGLEGAERMIAHLNNMRIRELEGQNFWRDNVVNGGGDSIQQAKNYYKTYLTNKGQNQLDMGNWRSIASGKFGFSPINWEQGPAATNHQQRKIDRQRKIYFDIKEAESLGFEYAQRGSRGSVQSYFRSKAGAAASYVRDVKRRASALGVDPSRAAYDQFSQEVADFTASTGLSSAVVRSWRYTMQGYNDLLAVTAFNERAVIEEAAV